MGDVVSDWPRLLSLAVHEFRTPVTVVSGYLRMLLRDRAGPLAENQRKLLEEAEKSCARLSGLLGEMGELGQLLDGRQALSANTTDLAALLREVQATVPASDDQPSVHIDAGDHPLIVAGDSPRLRRVVEAIVHALRREIIDESSLVVEASSRVRDGGRAAWVAFGTPAVAAALRDASADNLGPFDQWRGGCGLALPLARQVVEMHGGRLMALPGERQKSGGVLELPLVS